MLTQKTMHTIMQELSVNRPVFHSEADFQFALAWKIEKKYPGVRLEYPIRDTGEGPVYIDIIVKIGKMVVPIELKYKTREIEHSIEGEKFQLAGHGAANLNRYWYLRDVERIEKSRTFPGFAKGFAIFLTNDSSYWDGTDKDRDDEAFRIHDKITIPRSEHLKGGELKWKNPTSKRKNMKSGIKLDGNYHIDWKKYPKPLNSEFNDEFRYLILEIKK